ncbi:hypothetical protein DdX_15089 [Ditylenchus destructor]|uniref:Uncharacterized protein n=1 Tax=Ditylenchus destructor TaxID=166010 RepID=A0AAD4MQX2_9BILA|nr:hypothetical protein DdX_15089 [Ditylenchus destructor]
MTLPYLKLFGLLLVPLVLVSTQDNRQFNDPENSIARLHVVSDCVVNNDCRPLFILYFLDGYCDVIRNYDGIIIKHGCRYELNWLIFLLLFLLPLLLLTIGLLSCAFSRRSRHRSDDQRPRYVETIKPNYDVQPTNIKISTPVI